MELLTLEKIAQIALYKKGKFINSPQTQYYVGYIQFENEIKIVKISRRSLMHIVEKGDIGIKLALYLRDVLLFPEAIVKNFKNHNRFFVFKVIENSIFALIIELKEKQNSIITAMIVDPDYIKKHFPGVSIK